MKKWQHSPSTAVQIPPLNAAVPNIPEAIPCSNRTLFAPKCSVDRECRRYVERARAIKPVRRIIERARGVESFTAVILLLPSSGVNALRCHHERAYRECTKPFHLHGHGKELPPPRRRLIQSTQMLGDRDIVLEQRTMHRTLARIGVIDVK